MSLCIRLGWCGLLFFTQPALGQSLLRSGDVISFRALAVGSEKVWLDCNTGAGLISLVANTDFERFSGTHWRVHDNQDGSYAFECLGKTPGKRWLQIDKQGARLGSGVDRKQAARWRLAGERLEAVGLQNLTAEIPANWLHGLPQTATTTLSEVPETSWQIVVQSRADYSQEGRWSPVVDLPESGIHTHLLPDGRVLFWSRFYDPMDQAATLEGVPVGGPSTFLLDPGSGTVTTLPNAPMDVFCSGHAFLPDGRLLVTGGHVMSNVGPKSTQIFDSRTMSWEHREEWDMNAGRWYPTNLTLSTGEVLTISGDATSQDDVNRIPQIWGEQGGWRDLTGLKDVCFNAAPAPCMPLYPWAHMAPNGQVFISGPGQLTGYIDTQGVGTWTPLGKTSRGWRGDYEATSTMYAPGKIMIAGGLPATASVELIDLNAASPAWREGPSLKYPRHKLTSTILADGSVLVSGGTARDGNQDDFAVYATEIWNPETETWIEGDHLSVPRLYHSTAVLLPDGRVLSMGGGLGAGYLTHKNMQIYTPGYLLRGPRPSIALTRRELSYGQKLVLHSAEAAHIRKAHLIKLSSDTHSFNSNQLIVPLKFTAQSATMELSIPKDPHLATPGHYLLFIVDEAGVPSVGEIVQLVRK